jgi:predicted DNA-binding protein
MKEIRETTVSFRATKALKKRLKQAARRAGMTSAAFCENAVLAMIEVGEPA